jgi:O-acetyl-ADP-ribose deacetylase (regulator of RNase III)
MLSVRFLRSLVRMALPSTTRGATSAAATQPPHPVHGETDATIELVLGDLVDERVDVIISPVGEGGTGTSRAQLAIHRAAGAGLAEEYERAIARLPRGVIAPLGNVVTGGHALSCRYVVHTRPLEAALAHDGVEAALARCLGAAFEASRALEARSVALPAIGTGAYGYRVATAARVAVRAALDAQRDPRGPRHVRFLLAGPATLETFLHALSEARAERAR